MAHFMHIKTQNIDTQQIMKIENKNTASQVRLLYALIPAIIVLTVAAIYLLNVATGFAPILTGACLLAIYAIFAITMNYHYIMIFIGPDKILVRFKALWPIRTDNNSFEINTTDFAGYEIIKTPFRNNLVIFKNTPGGKAEYPKVNINLLDNESVEKMKRAFALLETIKKTQ